MASSIVLSSVDATVGCSSAPDPAVYMLSATLPVSMAAAHVAVVSFAGDTVFGWGVPGPPFLSSILLACFPDHQQYLEIPPCCRIRVLSLEGLRRFGSSLVLVSDGFGLMTEWWWS